MRRPGLKTLLAKVSNPEAEPGFKIWAFCLQIYNVNLFYCHRTLMSLLGKKKFPWTIMCDDHNYKNILFIVGFFRAFAMLLYVVPLQESN